MPGRGKKIINKPLVHASLLATHIPSMVCESVAAIEEDKQYEKRRIDNLVAHWKSNPGSSISRENDCTIRFALSGRECFVTRAELQGIGTLLRTCSELLQLEKHVSLHMCYAGGRVFGRLWAEHCIGCDDSECARYLRGAILQAVVDS